ncbi:hypothetical protein WA577_004399, partial [Blastocystis sp. JDR]
SFSCTDEREAKLVLQNLPKLTTFITEDENGESFSGVRSVVLENMPNLNQVVLPRYAFDKVDEFKVENAGAFMDHPSVPYHNPKANVHSILEARTLSSSITRFIVDCCCCNDDQLSTLDFSYWESIKDIEIGSQSFRYVIGVDIVGLNQLERVVIGR